jgi:hypothetical protein
MSIMNVISTENGRYCYIRVHNNDTNNRNRIEEQYIWLGVYECVFHEFVTKKKKIDQRRTETIVVQM